MYPTVALQRRRLKPAIDLLLQNNDNEHASCYIHLFSNGGMFTTAHLLLAYRFATGGKPLRVSAMVLDSAPGVAAPSRSLKALTYGLPKALVIRQITYALLVMMVWGSWIVRRLMLRMEDPFAFTRRATLDKELVIAALRKKETEGKEDVIKSCYIYSESDDLVPWTDVEEHAAMAVTKGRKVELEKFKGSPHVGHMRQDPEKYWAIVKRYLFC